MHFLLPAKCNFKKMTTSYTSKDSHACAFAQKGCKPAFTPPAEGTAARRRLAVLPRRGEGIGPVVSIETTRCVEGQVRETGKGVRESKSASRYSSMADEPLCR